MRTLSKSAVFLTIALLVFPFNSLVQAFVGSNADVVSPISQQRSSGKLQDNCVKNMKLTVTDLAQAWQASVRSAARTWVNAGSNVNILSNTPASATQPLITVLGFTLAECEIRVVQASKLPSDVYTSVTELSGVAGLAMMQIKNGQQVATLVVLNDLVPQFADMPNSRAGWSTAKGILPSGKLDVETIALHELGHAIGLPHISDILTVMCGNEMDHVIALLGFKRRNLTSKDIQSLIAMYGKRGRPMPNDVPAISPTATPAPVTTPTLQPTATPQAIIDSFTADRMTINAGESVRFSWKVQNVKAVYFDNEAVGGEDNRERRPDRTREYVLTIVKLDGNQETRSVTISVNVPQIEPNVQMRADRNPINQGECVRVSWDVDNINAIYFDGQGVTGHDGRDVCPVATRDYVLDVRWGNGNQKLQSITINVNPAQPTAGYIKVVQPLQFSAETGERVTVRATFKIRNTGGSDITIEELAAGARKGSDWSGEWCDFPHVFSITLRPGEEYFYDQTRDFTEHGHYMAEPVMKLSGSNWGGINGANRIEFDVS